MYLIFEVMYCVYLFMNFNKMILIAEHPLMADNVVSKINTDYEIRLVCCYGFFYNPHVFLKLHYRPCVPMTR